MFGLHLLPMLRGSFVTKRCRRGGTSYVTLQKISAGKCYHSKMKLLYGKRPVKRVVMLLGEAAGYLPVFLFHFLFQLINECIIN